MLFVDRPLQDLVGAPGINSIADLHGKVVAISSRGGLQDIIMRRMLTQSKLDLNQITIITIPGQTAMISALKTKRVAAAMLNPPFNFLAYREGLNNWGSRESTCACRVPESQRLAKPSNAHRIKCAG
jgi:ABC-type amino acid transport substrate-binding protein